MDVVQAISSLLAPEPPKAELPQLRYLKTVLTKENSWLRILTLLSEGPEHPSAIAEILRARGLNCRDQTVYVNVWRLHKQGLLMRYRDKKDKRLAYYELTPEGVAVLEQTSIFLKEVFDQLHPK